MDHNIDIPPFYIGQEIVAKESASLWNKGDEFTVLGIHKCGCGKWMVHPSGLDEIPFQVFCDDCGHYIGRYFLAACFEPKVKFGTFISMKEVINLELIAVN